MPDAEEMELDECDRVLVRDSEANRPIYRTPESGAAPDGADRRPRDDEPR